MGENWVTSLIYLLLFFGGGMGCGMWLWHRLVLRERREAAKQRNEKWLRPRLTWSFGPSGITLSNGHKNGHKKTIPWARLIEIAGGSPGSDISVHDCSTGGWILIAGHGFKMSVRRLSFTELERLFAESDQSDAEASDE